VPESAGLQLVRLGLVPEPLLRDAVPAMPDDADRIAKLSREIKMYEPFRLIQLGADTWLCQCGHTNPKFAIWCKRCIGHYESAKVR
jgi:hypothetical protein